MDGQIGVHAALTSQLCASKNWGTALNANMEDGSVGGLISIWGDTSVRAKPGGSYRNPSVFESIYNKRTNEPLCLRPRAPRGVVLSSRARASLSGRDQFTPESDRGQI